MGNYLEISMYPSGDYVIIKDSALRVLKRLAASNDDDGNVESTRHDNFHSKLYDVSASGSHGAFKDLYSTKVFTMLKKSIKGTLKIEYHDRDAPQLLHKTIKGSMK